MIDSPSSFSLFAYDNGMPHINIQRLRFAKRLEAMAISNCQKSYTNGDRY
jgi:hypothetical protein